MQGFEILAGWRIYVTNALEKGLSLAQAVDRYLGQWQPGLGVRRLKGRSLAAVTLYLGDGSHIRGMMVLWSITLRVVTRVEFVVCRELKAKDKSLAGLYEGNAGRKTAFHHRAPAESFRGHHPSPLQKRILTLMALPESIYVPP